MSILRAVLAVVLGLVVGSAVNMGLILLGGLLIPAPPGADMQTAQGIGAALPALQPRHFLFPFLAHALGTFAGACVAVRIAARHRAAVALTVGVFFLAGGVMAAGMIPAPAWFIVLDLACAYIPSALLGYRVARPRTG